MAFEWLRSAGEFKMHQALAAIFWVAAYVALMIGPLGLMLLGAVPQGRGFWTELAIALGFIGLAQLTIQFTLIARFKRITAPYGIDAIMYYHRQIGTLTVLIIAAHPLILIADEPVLLDLLKPWAGSWGSRTGVWSAIALGLLVLLAFFRRPLRLSYEVWRTSHAAFALLALGLALVHVTLTGSYVNGGWKLATWIVFVGLGVIALSYPRLVKPFQEKRRPYRVIEVRREAERTWSLVVEPVGHGGMQFEPGQFAWLKLRHPLNLDEHPFSFSSSAENQQRLEFGIKQVGDFTQKLPEIPPGTAIYLDGPHGAFSVDRLPSAGYVFIAGGIGIVPILSMIRTMADRGDRRPVRLIYAAKDLPTLAYREELDGLKERAPLFLEIVYVLEQSPAEWSGETGLVTPELLKRHWPREHLTRDVLICGPDPMIRSVDAGLRKMGLPPARLHAERFELV